MPSSQDKYTKSITSVHRSAFILMIDQSASMREHVIFDNKQITKAEAVAEIANRMLFELIERSRRGNEVRNYYDVATIAYADNKVSSLLTNDKTTFEFTPIDELAQRDVAQQIWCSEYCLENGSHTILKCATPQYITPCAEGSTPMFEAMLIVRDMVKQWSQTEENIDSFPPIIINVTDGEFSDCDVQELIDITHDIRSLATRNGNVLLLNLHIAPYCENPLIFPSRQEIDSSPRLAQILAKCSSTMPDLFNSMIIEYRSAECIPPFVGMGYNAPITEILTMINIGSVSVNNFE